MQWALSVPPYTGAQVPYVCPQSLPGDSTQSQHREESDWGGGSKVCTLALLGTWKDVQIISEPTRLKEMVPEQGILNQVCRSGDSSIFRAYPLR